jgi:hypothetical protein
VAGGCVAALRRKRGAPLAVRLLPLAALSLLFWVRAISRADRAHLLPVAIVTAVMGAALCYRLWRRRGGGGQPREAGRGFGRLALAGAAGAVLLLGYTYVARPIEAWARTVDPALLPSLTRCGGCALVGEDERAALTLVRDLTAPDERIFVGTARHDLIQLNDVLFYFLVPRRSATRYHVLHPGVATTAPVQREIVDELNRWDVRVVVLWSGDALPGEANESSVSSGVTLLDDYLRSTYHQVAAFGPYSVWRRP